MSFEPNMPAAAHRHLIAADILNTEKGRPDVAGYLYGIAAECAIKAMMLEANLWPIPDPANRAGSPYYAHFPELRTMLRDTLQSRRGTPLVNFVSNDNFLTQWSTNMRYAKGNSVDPRWIVLWSQQAKSAVGAMGT